MHRRYNSLRIQQKQRLWRHKHTNTHTKQSHSTNGRHSSPLFGWQTTGNHANCLTMRWHKLPCSLLVFQRKERPSQQRDVIRVWFSENSASVLGGRALSTPEIGSHDSSGNNESGLGRWFLDKIWQLKWYLYCSFKGSYSKRSRPFWKFFFNPFSSEIISSKCAWNLANEILWGENYQAKSLSKHKLKWNERGFLIRMRFETDRSFNWSFRLSVDEFMSQQAFVGRNSREMHIEIKAIAHKINWTLHYRVGRCFMTVSWWIQFAPMPHCLSRDA